MPLPAQSRVGAVNGRLPGDGPPSFYQRGDKVLVEAVVTQAFAEDTCVQIEVGGRGYLQSIWAATRGVRPRAER